MRERDPHDPRIRELVYRLAGMAPDTPPFPEEPMVRLEERSTNRAARRRRPALLAAAAAVVGVLTLVGIPLLLLSGGDVPVGATSTTTAPDQTAPTTAGPTPTSTSTTVAPVEAADVVVYLLTDPDPTSRIPGPVLVPVMAPAPGPAVNDGDAAEEVRVALEALIAQPAAADTMFSSIPPGTRLLDVGVDGGVAAVDLSAEFGSVGGSLAVTSRLAQVVYTATRHPAVEAVEFRIDGEVVTVFSAEGLVLDGPQTRGDYVDLLPLIFIDEPAVGATVTLPLGVRGVANTFEATLLWKAERLDAEGSVVLGEGFTTATCGTGCWGEFAITIEGEASPGSRLRITLWEVSAQDGSPVNVIERTVEVG